MNGVFTESQEELTESVWDAMIYKQKAKQIEQEIQDYIQGR